MHKNSSIEKEENFSLKEYIKNTVQIRLEEERTAVETLAANIFKSIKNDFEKEVKDTISNHKYTVSKCIDGSEYLTCEINIKNKVDIPKNLNTGALFMKLKENINRIYRLGVDICMYDKKSNNVIIHFTFNI
jgi:hypothetical protein